VSAQSRRKFPLASIAMLGLAAFFIFQREPTTLGWVLIVLLLIGGSLGLLLWWISGFVPTDSAEAARDILQTQKALYCGEHEFRVVAEPRREFRGADFDYYARTQQVLERSGFDCLGDVEDVTTARQFPSMRAFLRVMSGDDGSVMAAIYHVRVSGFIRMMQIIGVVPRQMKMLDLETELSDGSFIVTCNSLGADTTGAVPRVARFQYARETPPAELLDLHRQQVQQALIRDRGLSPRPARTLDDVIAAQHRLQAIKNAHKQKIGYMDRHELANIAGGESATVQDVADEIERQKRS
jgi:hypothetical protein